MAAVRADAAGEHTMLIAETLYSIDFQEPAKKCTRMKHTKKEKSFGNVNDNRLVVEIPYQKRHQTHKRPICNPR